MATSQPIDPSAQNQRDEGMMTLREHLVEFRWRLTISVVAILVCSLAFWPFKDFIFDLLQSPLGQDVHLQQIEPTEAFFSFFKVAVLGGIGIASPVVLYQIMAYVSPGLYPNEKRIFYASIPAMLAMFFIGVMFCWFVILRFTLNFLTGFAPEDINTELSIDSYVSFVARMLLVVGLVFETPFAIFLLAKFRIVSAKRLKGFRRLCDRGHRDPGGGHHPDPGPVHADGRGYPDVRPLRAGRPAGRPGADRGPSGKF